MLFYENTSKSLHPVIDYFPLAAHPVTDRQWCCNNQTHSLIIYSAARLYYMQLHTPSLHERHYSELTSA